MSSIGERIKNLRKNNGMSQRKLADLMELNHSAICKMENGKSYPSRKNAEKLAHIFAVDLSTFYEPDNEDIKRVTLGQRIDKRLEGLELTEEQTEKLTKAILDFIEAIK